MTQLLERIDLGSDRALGRYHNIIIVIRRRTPTAAEVEVLGRQFQQTLKRFPSGQVIIQLSIAEKFDFPFPDDDVRKRIAEFMSQHASKILLLAVVPPPGSLMRAATRSFLLGAKLLGRLKTPIELCTDAAEAVQRACAVAQPHTQAQLDPKEAMACIDQLRALHQQEEAAAATAAKYAAPKSR